MSNDFPIFVQNDAHGVPFCTREKCPSFDGKRCRVTGFQPHSVCEPAVREMARVIREATEQVQ